MLKPGCSTCCPDCAYSHKYISDIIGQPTGTGWDLTRRGGGPIPTPAGFLFTHTHTHTPMSYYMHLIQRYNLIQRLQHCILGNHRGRPQFVVKGQSCHPQTNYWPHSPKGQMRISMLPEVSPRRCGCRLSLRKKTWYATYE